MYTVPSPKTLLFFVPRGFGVAGGAQLRTLFRYLGQRRSGVLVKLLSFSLLLLILLVCYAFGTNDVLCPTQILSIAD
jgi:hypothetical protein